MKDYTELTCTIRSENPEIVTDILIAQLSEVGFESFTEEENKVLAYIVSGEFDFEIIKNLQINSTELGEIEYQHIDIKTKNWNEEWEKNFEPIVVASKCIIKAPFHQDTPKFDIEITIMPKMSFGTGHHATTFLMIQEMLKLDFNNKTVMDMGCGTGVLAILAEFLNASSISAIDNNDWAYENAVENFQLNNCKNIDAILGDVHKVPEVQFDIILANINRNVLLEDIKFYSKLLKPKGQLLLSGIYSDDLEMVRIEAENQTLKFIHYAEKNAWVAALFSKS